MNRLLLAVLLACLVSPDAFPQDLTEKQQNILKAVDSRDHAAAVTALLDLEKRDNKAFTANNYDYLLARMAEAKGDLGVAMTNYQRVAGRNSVLRPYAIAHMSRAARSTGNLLLERLCLLQLLGSSPNALISGGAKGRLAQNSYEAANYAETIRILSSGENKAGPTDSSQKDQSARREALVLLGNAKLRAGKPDQARDVFNSLITTIQNPDQPDDAAESACLGLDQLDGGNENFGKKAPAIAEDQHLLRANIYRFNRDFANAKLHLDAVIENDITGPKSADSIYLIGRGFAQQSEYGEALKWFERVLEQFPEHPAAKDALLQAASAYSRVGKPKEAINRYHKYIDRYPSDEKLDRAYLNIVDIYRDQGSDSDALKWCTKTEEAFVGKLPATLALFTKARIRIARDEWELALADLERLAKISDLGGIASPGSTNTAEITFLKAYVLEQLKRYAASIDEYLSIPDGRDSYYGGLATERLKKLSDR